MQEAMTNYGNLVKAISENMPTPDGDKALEEKKAILFEKATLKKEKLNFFFYDIMIKAC
jgi:hypothetical protein